MWLVRGYALWASEQEQLLVWQGNLISLDWDFLALDFFLEKNYNILYNANNKHICKNVQV